jgi:CMP-N,N'-diacetyllegionaminic acid synthase
MKKKNKKVICFDLDGVLCSTSENNYLQSRPIKKNIKLVNKLYADGYKIKIFTARYMGRSNNNKKIATLRAKKITLNQLKLWKVKFHELIFGKPTYDIFVDDKALFFKKNWSKYLLKKI